MARVAIITRWATYQGDLELTAPSGLEVRFLDALNHPHRLVGNSGRATPSLLLANVVRRDDLAGKVVQCGSEVSVRPGAVISGYEVTPVERDREAVPEASYEQRRHAQESERIFLYMENGWRVEGLVGGSLGTLDSAKPGRDFVACRDVILSDPRRSGSEKELPFLAVNVRRLEAAGLLEVGR